MILLSPRSTLFPYTTLFRSAFVFVALSGPLVPRLRRSALAGAVLDGVNVASLALMAVVSWQLARAALVDALTVRSEEHTSELQSRLHLVCRLLLEKKKKRSR